MVTTWNTVSDSQMQARHVWMLVTRWNTMNDTQVQAGQVWMLGTEPTNTTDGAF